MKIIDKSEDKTWIHRCGCVLEKKGFMWIRKSHCKRHTMNSQKKADKLMKERKKKRGRGWTKPLGNKMQKGALAEKETRQKII